MTREEQGQTIAVLARLGLPRAKRDWRFHLANSAGRARCGALLTLSEWQVRDLPHPPRDLCERCARILNPKGSPTRARVPHSTTPSDDGQEQQLGLPL